MKLKQMILTAAVVLLGSPVWAQTPYIYNTNTGVTVGPVRVNIGQTAQPAYPVYQPAPIRPAPVYNPKYAQPTYNNYGHNYARPKPVHRHHGEDHDNGNHGQKGQHGHDD